MKKVYNRGKHLGAKRKLGKYTTFSG